jgi:hypothetical protein
VNSPIGKFVTPSSKIDHVHEDIVGPLPPSQGFWYILTCVTRFSRWPEAALMDDIESKTIARTLLDTWILRYNVPQRITTDRCRQFESTLFGELTQLMGTKHLQTTAYHPQANGMAEIHTSPSDSRNPEEPFQSRSGRKIRFPERIQAGFQ